MSLGHNSNEARNQRVMTVAQIFNGKLAKLKQLEVCIPKRRMNIIPPVSVLAAIQSAEQLIRDYKKISSFKRKLQFGRKDVDVAIEKARKELKTFLFLQSSIDEETREIFNLAAKNIDPKNHPNSERTLGLVYSVFDSIKKLEELKFQIPLLEIMKSLLPDKDSSQANKAEKDAIETVHDLCESTSECLKEQDKLMSRIKELSDAAGTRPDSPRFKVR